MITLTERTRMRLYVRRVMIDVAARYGLSLRQLVDRPRNQERIEPRMAVVLKCRMAGIPLQVIGQLLHRDHNTVANAQVRALGAELEPVLATLPEYAPRARVTPCNGCGGSGIHPATASSRSPIFAICGACHGDGGWGTVPLWLLIRRAGVAGVAA